MESSAEQPADVGVRFAPRLTEDSLPVTLPKDAERSAEVPVSSIEAPPNFEPEDKPVSAGVLDLQLVPQVCLIREHLRSPCLLNWSSGHVCAAAARTPDKKSAAATSAAAEGC